MMHVVTGGSGSGKSVYAEEWLLEQETGPYLYVATMIPYGEESQIKIQKHRMQRRGKGFDTKECYRDMKSMDVPDNRGILLECVSNLLANELYTEEGIMNAPEDVRKKVIEGIIHLKDCTSRLAVVTNEIHSDVQDYSDETKTYIRLLGQINQELASMADKVTEVVYGIPLQIKG